MQLRGNKRSRRVLRGRRQRQRSACSCMVAVMWTMRDGSSALARVVATLGILSCAAQAASIRTPVRALCPSLSRQALGVPRRRLDDGRTGSGCSAFACVLTAASGFPTDYTRVGTGHVAPSTRIQIARGEPRA